MTYFDAYLFITGWDEKAQQYILKRPENMCCFKHNPQIAASSDYNLPIDCEDEEFKKAKAKLLDPGEDEDEISIG